LRISSKHAHTHQLMLMINEMEADTENASPDVDTREQTPSRESMEVNANLEDTCTNPDSINKADDATMNITDTNKTEHFKTHLPEREEENCSKEIEETRKTLVDSGATVHSGWLSDDNVEVRDHSIDEDEENDIIEGGSKSMVSTERTIEDTVINPAALATEEEMDELTEDDGATSLPIIDASNVHSTQPLAQKFTSTPSVSNYLPIDVTQAPPIDFTVESAEQMDESVSGEATCEGQAISQQTDHDKPTAVSVSYATVSSVLDSIMSTAASEELFLPTSVAMDSTEEDHSVPPAAVPSSSSVPVSSSDQYRSMIREEITKLLPEIIHSVQSPTREAQESVSGKMIFIF